MNEQNFPAPVAASPKPATSNGRGCFRWFAWLGGTFLLLFVVLYVVLSWPSVLHGRYLRSMIRSAETVTVHEYAMVNVMAANKRGDKDKAFRDELTSVVLNQAQKDTLAAAFEGVGIEDTGKACDFVPHHRIVCRMKDGTTHEILLCFRCGDIGVDDDPLIDMKSVWGKALIIALEGCGVPVRPGSYREEYSKP